MHPRYQQGIGLVSAIFLIMITALLAVAIAQSVRTSADAFALEIVSERALLAAESGAELALNRAYAPSPSCTDRTWSLDVIGLPACNAAVSCRAATVDGDDYLTIESQGRCGGSDVVAERVVVVRTAP